MSNVLVSLTAAQVRALEKARHILARKEAMGERYGTLVDDLSDILGMARAERLHSVKVPDDMPEAGGVTIGGLTFDSADMNALTKLATGQDIDGLDPDDPRSDGWASRKADLWDMREGK